MNEKDKKIEEWIDHIKLDGKVETELESLRFSILEDVHRKMDAAEKSKRFPLKRLLVAASFGLLVAMSVWLAYQFDFLRGNKEMLQMACPLGVKSTVTLPDGTTVLLNGGATLSYASSEYGKKERRVVLDGEAYFDVKRNEDVPFIVSSGVAQVRVLGTRFNVDAYQSDDYVKVTLESGKVSMKVADEKEECVLLPNQQAVYDKKTHKLSRRTVKASEVIAWGNDEMYFNDTPLEEIAKKLERRFNVRIVISSEQLRQVRFNGAFTADDDWARILSFFSTMDNRLNYKKHNGEILIYEARPSDEEQ